MGASEINAAGDAVAVGLREATTSVEAIHHQIARRCFSAAGPLGPVARTVRFAHDTISAGVYAGVRAGVTLTAGGGALLGAATEPRWATAERVRAGSFVRSALNGAFGDLLEHHDSPLATPMGIRAGGHDVACEPAALAAAYPDAGPRVAILVHGLCESDRSWRAESPDSYPAQLREDLAVTSVTLRYNSGLALAENGARLDALLEQLVAAWPVAVSQLILIGHSMGGLIIRSACHTAGSGNRRWLGQVGHAVYLGAPHGGSSVEKGARVAAGAMQRVAELRPLAAALNTRSAGVKDMHFGEFSAGHVPLNPFIRHHAVSATLGEQPHSALSILFGDLLVRHASATGRGARGRADLRFAPGDVHHVGRSDHFDLLGHPAVYARLRDWLAPRALGAGPALS